MASKTALMCTDILIIADDIHQYGFLTRDNVKGMVHHHHLSTLNSKESPTDYYCYIL